MKVIFIINEKRLILPCGSGKLTVREMISRAMTRYKRMTKNKIHITVRALKTAASEAYLDTEDIVADVLQNGEEVIAEVHEKRPPSKKVKLSDPSTQADKSSLDHVQSDTQHAPSTQQTKIYPIDIPGWYERELLPSDHELDASARKCLKEITDDFTKDPHEYIKVLLQERPDVLEEFTSVHPDRVVKFNQTFSVRQVIRWQRFAEDLLRKSILNDD